MSLHHSTEIECARQTRRSLLLVRERLLNPTAQVLESCAPHLRVAIDSLAQLQGLLDKAEWQTRLELRPEVSALCKEMAEINVLMQNASSFHAVLALLLTPQVDDSIRYAASGVVEAKPASTMLLEG